MLQALRTIGVWAWRPDWSRLTEIGVGGHSVDDVWGRGGT